MKKTMMICVALLSSAMLLASFASASPGKNGKPATAKNLAAKQCAAEKKADPVAFRDLYGKHAMRDCIKAQTPEAKSELKNAAEECKSERSADPDGFKETYGSAKSKGHNAFGKCVSTKVKEMEDSPTA